MKKKKNKKKKKTPSPVDKDHIDWVEKWGKKENTNKVPDYIPEEKTDTKKDGEGGAWVIGLIVIVFWVIMFSVFNAIDKADPIDKAKGFFDDRGAKKERCAERAEDASNSYAAKKIYKACMGR